MQRRGAGSARSTVWSRSGVWQRLLLVLALTLGMVPVQTAAPAPASAAPNLGEFRVKNYASGFAPNNYLWRGYAFRVARQVTVTHLVGGGGPNC